MRFSRESDILIAHLDGAINFSNSTEIKMQLREGLSKTDRDLILDLKQLEFADSSGVGVMVSLLKTITANGGLMRICEAGEEMSFVLKMTKIDLIIPLFSTLEAAKKSIVEERSNQKEIVPSTSSIE